MELTIDQALQRGITAHKEGKLQDAENLYRSILNAQPAHPDANHNLGMLAIGVGKVEAALPHLKTALEGNPKIEQFWVSYIDALIRLGQSETARQVLQRGEGSGLTGAKSAELKSRLVDVPVASAGGKAEIDGLIALYNQGKLEEGLVLGNALAAQFPENAMIPNILGVIYSGLGRYDEAVTSYNRAIELKPDYGEAHYNCGNVLKKLSQYEGAITYYNKVIELNPNYADVYNNLGNTYNQLNRYDEAIINFEKALELKPHYPCLLYTSPSPRDGLLSRMPSSA